jgi:quercetin dioxygenase-like cupin family protein
MKIESFNEDLNFNEDKIMTKVVLESSFTKEIRILLKKGQIMKEHQTAFPIVVHVISGKILFGVKGNEELIMQGNIIALEGSTPHNLIAQEDSVIRLSLSKQDKVERVEKVAGL